MTQNVVKQNQNRKTNQIGIDSNANLNEVHKMYICEAYWNHSETEKKEEKCLTIFCRIYRMDWFCLMLCVFMKIIGLSMLSISKMILVYKFIYCILGNFVSEFVFFSCPFGHTIRFLGRNDIHLLCLLWKVTALWEPN